MLAASPHGPAPKAPSRAVGHYPSGHWRALAFLFAIRWLFWLLALVIVAFGMAASVNLEYRYPLLGVTFAQLVIGSAYGFLPRLRTRLLRLLQRLGRYPYVWLAGGPLVLSILDMTLSLAVIFVSGGWGSPFYHFGVASLIVPAYLLSVGGALAVSSLFDAAYLIAAATMGDGMRGIRRDGAIGELIGALLTPIGVALVVNYLGRLVSALDLERERTSRALAEAGVLYRVANAALEGEGAAGHEEPLLRQAADAVQQSGRYSAFAVVLEGEDGETLSYRAGFGRGSVGGEQGALLPGQDLIALAREQGQPVELPRPESFGRHSMGYVWEGCAPIRVGGRTIGAVAASQRDPRPDEERLPLLTAVASQLALALENIALQREKEQLAALEERNRIAREVHDGIAQAIYTLSLSLETCVDLAARESPSTADRLARLVPLARAALLETRQYLFQLKPLLAGQASLGETLLAQCRECQAVTGLSVDFCVLGEERKVPPALGTAFYRILQEALANVYKHAGASSVRVELSFGSEEVALAVADDGVGFNWPDVEAGTARRGYGLAGIQERVQALGGSLVVQSAPGAGTRLTVRLPLPA